MANKKFSEFTTKTDSANVDFVVGYEGTTNVKIAPSNLSSGGASSLNGLTDCLIDGTSSYLVNIPAGLSGNPIANTILGYDAGESLTNGAGNTLLGSYSARLGNASYNVAIGLEAYRSLDSNKNVAVGAYGGYLATGEGSLFIGYESGRSSTANNSVHMGHQAGYSNTSGTGNTNIGYQAGYSNTTGASRVIIGYEAGENNTGSNNVFLGKATGKGSGSGSQTIAIGQGVMETASAANNCVFIGNYMAANCTSGSESTVAIGTNCLSPAGYSGEGNTAVGNQAGNNLSSGDNNTLIGRNAGDGITTSPDNTFIGKQSGLVFNNTSGDGRNVGVGSISAGALTTGIYNVFVGYAAGNASGGSSSTVTTGNFNTMVGYEAKGSSTAASNQNSFGYSAACSANNQITLGDSSIGALRCQVTSITALSDERDKTSIEVLPYGLDFVNSLQPKKFVWDNRAETNGNGEEFFSANKGKKDIGFIAQELQSVDDDFLNLVYDENPEKLEATYGRLIPVLVKAIQDLSAKVTALENA